MSSFLSRGIQTTMSTKSVSFFSRKSRPGRVSSGIVEATMKSACHSIFLNQVPWLQAKTVQVQKHPSDVLAASHDIVLHDHRPQFWLMMPAQYVLDHGKNNESYSTGPNLVRSVCLKTRPKLQKHRGSQMLESQMGLGCLGVKAIIKTIWLGAKAVPSHQFSVFIAWNHLLSHDSHKGVEPRNSKQWTLANWPNQETIVPWSSMWSP